MTQRAQGNSEAARLAAPITRAPLSQSPWRWVMLAGVWLLYASFGMTAAGLAPLVTPISRELGLDFATVGLIMGAWPMLYLLTAIPAGAWMDRVGIGNGLLVAAALITLSAALRPFATSGSTLFAAVAVFGLGGPLVSVGAPKLIAQWFDERGRRTAIGIYMTGVATGAVTALVLAGDVLLPAFDGDWRAVLKCFIVAPALAGIVWWGVNRHHQAQAANAPPMPRPSFRPELAQAGARLLQLLAVRRVRWVLALGAAVFFVNHGLNNWLPEMLHATGLTLGEASRWATVPMLIGIPATLLLPRLATPARRVVLLALLCVTAAISIVALGLIGVGPAPPASAALWAALLLQGSARSAMMPVAVLLLIETDEVPASATGAASGLFFTAAEIGGVLGPLAIGMTADLSGGFGWACAMLAALSAAIAMALFLARFRESVRASR